MYDALVLAAVQLFSVQGLSFLTLGVTVGLVIGPIPGLGGVVGMSILLPFVFGMDYVPGLAMLIGMTAVTQTSDTFPAVLLGIPGTSGSQATVMDGYPMARLGRANTALGAAFTASAVGGVIGALVLVLIIPIARPLVLSFGSPELFMLAVFGVSLVGVLSKGSILAGLLSSLVGLLLATVGIAAQSVDYRFTFGTMYLWDGFSLVLVALGLFAIPEIVQLLRDGGSISRSAAPAGSAVMASTDRMSDGPRAAMQHKALILRSSGVGAALGMIPGIGGSVIDWIAYGVAAQTSKNGDQFGKGDIRGVIAPESANNAKEGGALVPTLLFGIPGSGTTAVLLGGLVLLGIQPGPRMATDRLDVLMVILLSLVIANLMGAAACLLAAKWFSKLCLVPAVKLAPFLIVVITTAAFQSRFSNADLLVFVLLGVFSWQMKRQGWPRPPLLVGFVLGVAAERYLWISMSRYGLEWLSRPGVIAIAAITVGAILLSARRSPR